MGFWAEVVEAAIRARGYEPLRLDHAGHHSPIDDQIIASVRAARFVVSDLTGQRGGVKREAGFALGLGLGLSLPVIFMVREDAQADLHFDVQQQNFNVWQAGDLHAAKRRLESRIRATWGQGPLEPGRA